MTKRAILIDTERCTGCWTCAMVCHMGNHLGEDEFYIDVRTRGAGPVDEPKGEFPDLEMSWMPVFTGECPQCAERVAAGVEPLCMRNCPTRAIIHGDIDDAEGELRRRYDVLSERGYKESRAALAGADTEVVYMSKRD